jgi:hypothetical protein
VMGWTAVKLHVVALSLQEKGLKRTTTAAGIRFGKHVLTGWAMHIPDVVCADVTVPSTWMGQTAAPQLRAEPCAFAVTGSCTQMSMPA